MERLVPVLNQLQSVLGLTGSNDILLPQLVVIGAQSSGKTSIAENIVGRDFLPRGNNIVTRRPLVLTLMTTSLPQHMTSDQYDPSLEWGEFDHLPSGTKFYEFSAIKIEIVSETERLLGKGSSISNDPIFLRIYSPYVPALTMVDLPGITKVPTGDQPLDIEKQIKTMVLQFISNPNSIIVAVSSATEDISNSEALKIARQVDPHGSRTLGVVTKIDLMDQGTDALNVLQNRSIPLKLGYIGVINRSQKDINTGKPIKDSLSSEREWFTNSPIYGIISKQLGTEFLTKRLSTLLLHHIQTHLPSIKQQINSTIMETQIELDSYRPPFESSEQQNGPLLLDLLSKYAASIISSLDGRSMGPSSYTDITTSELYGGARIAFVFNEIFGREIEQIDPFKNLSDHEIRTAIRNATGPRATLFLPEIAFELLIKRQIERLRHPSSICIDLILEELLRVGAQCQEGQAVPHLVNFPELKEKLLETLRQLVNSRVIQARQMVQNIINLELAYINTSHPDFIGGSRALTHLSNLKKQRLQAVQRQAQQTAAATAAGSGNSGNGNGGNGPELLSIEETQKQLLKQDQAHYVTMAEQWKQQQQKQQVENSGGIGGIGGNSMINDRLHTQFGNYTSDQVEFYSVAAPSEREMIEIEVIKLLIDSYFRIVKKTVKDIVPKAIMYMLVNKTKDDIQSELVKELYHESKFESLLKEGDDIGEKRKSCLELLRVMKKALEIVSSIKDLSLAM